MAITVPAKIEPSLALVNYSKYNEAKLAKILKDRGFSIPLHTQVQVMRAYLTFGMRGVVAEKGDECYSFRSVARSFLHDGGAGSCHGLFGVVLDFERILRLMVVEF
jgi:hypothetical protein